MSSSPGFEPTASSLVLRSEPRKFSEEIDYLLHALGGRTAHLREILDLMPRRTYLLLLILLSLPFCQPIPLPGVSTLFGAVIALLGWHLTLRRQPWLPKRLLTTPISGPLLVKLLTSSRRVALFFETMLRPRWPALIDSTPVQHLHGALIFISGVLLLLPLPIPFTNPLPALTVVLMSAAIAERDGLFVALALVSFVVCVAYFASIGLGGAAIWSFFFNWFGRHGAHPVSIEAPAG